MCLFVSVLVFGVKGKSFPAIMASSRHCDEGGLPSCCLTVSGEQLMLQEEIIITSISNWRVLSPGGR